MGKKGGEGLNYFFSDVIEILLDSAFKMWQSKIVRNQGGKNEGLKKHFSG